MISRHPIRLRSRLPIIAATIALALVAGTAGAAQYQWRDAKGRMVYSDLPPPSSVAPDRIIRAPAVVAAEPAKVAPVAAASPGASPAATAGAPNAPASAPSIAGLSNADREMAWRKRAADRAAEDKKAAEAANRKTELARACSDAQGNIRSLESGQRISRSNTAGEREFLSDAERVQRLAQARKNVGENC